jgi:hypothetical protein
MYDEKAMPPGQALFDRHLMTEPVEQPGLGAPRFGKRLRADNLPRSPIGHSQDDLSTTRIGQRDDVFHQLFKVKAALRLFEFEARTFWSLQITHNFVAGDWHGLRSAYITLSRRR